MSETDQLLKDAMDRSHDFEEAMERCGHFRRIVQPTDFSQGNVAAYVHALRIALAAKAELRLLHVGQKSAKVRWSDFPSVRSSLIAWGEVPADCSKEDVIARGVRVQKTKRSGDDPVEIILDYIDDHDPHLTVMATHQRQGMERWMNDAVAEPVARQSETMTLVVPRQVKGFVSAETGEVLLERILIPVDEDPPPQSAVDAAAALAGVLECRDVEFTLLHVGSEEDMPDVRLPVRPGWRVRRDIRRGDVVAKILQTAGDRSADLIVMATDGHNDLVDKLRGCSTERVMRQARQPLLVVPV